MVFQKLRVAICFAEFLIFNYNAYHYKKILIFVFKIISGLLVNFAQIFYY